VPLIARPTGYQPELRAAALACFRTEGVSAACRRFGVDKLTLYKWNGGSLGDPRKYSVGTKVAAVRMYREAGLGATCRAFRLAHRTVYRWLRELGPDGGAPEMRDEHADRLLEEEADEVVRDDEERLEDVVKEESDDALMEKAEASEVPDHGKKRRFSESFKASVLTAYASVGPKEAARQFGVSKRLVHEWRWKAGHPRLARCWGRPGPGKVPGAEVPGDEVPGQDEVPEAEVPGDKVPATKPGKRTRCGIPRPSYSAETRRSALEHYRQHGQHSTTAAFGLTASTLLRWRREAGEPSHAALRGAQEERADSRVREQLGEAKVERRTEAYDQAFRKKVLEHHKEHGQAATCKLFGICNATIYGWLKHGTASRRKPRYSLEARRGAVELAAAHGPRAAGRGLGLPVELVRRWLVEDKAATEAGDTKHSDLEKGYEGESVPEADISIKAGVVETAEREGLARAAAVHCLPLSTIWAWKDEARRARQTEARLRRMGSYQARRPWRRYSKELRAEAVGHYMQHGAARSAQHYSVPRQTVRHWALRRAAALAYSAERRQAAVAQARTQGVAAAIRDHKVLVMVTNLI
jgi:transposase-like protein